MKGVYKIIFTVIGDDLPFNDYFYVENIDQIREELNRLFKHYEVVDKDGCIIIENDAIFAAGEDCESLLITIESVNIVDTDGLKGIINGESALPSL